MGRQCIAAPTQEAVQIARPSKGRCRRGFPIGFAGDAGRLGADRPPLAAERKDAAAVRLGNVQ